MLIQKKTKKLSNKSSFIIIRVTDEEKKDLTQTAKDEGWRKFSEYIRNKLLSTE